MTRRELEIIEELMNMTVERVMAGSFSWNWSNENRREDLRNELLGESNQDEV